ncbi:MAG: hypothetical protein IIA45_01215 [Bacteroidetes bacterium]|nr:hypothetical protein [Bacteroidota bacterium]
MISDNRYGLWWNQSENPDNKVYTVFMTHQLHAKLPSFWKIFAPLFHRFTKRTLKRFDECWIPDIESENNLSGALSHPPISDAANNKRIIIDYIGPLSRFSRHARQTKKYNQVFILSGPEPQRTIFEEIILAQLENTVEKSLVVRGMPENMNIEKYSEHVDLASHMETEELNEIILAADLIVTRAGYSSIMDLAVMNRTAVLVPTPGQREQEYLAAYLMEKGFYYSENQDSFNLLRATRESKNYKGIDITDNKVVLRTRIGRLLERLISGTNLVSSEL